MKLARAIGSRLAFVAAVLLGAAFAAFVGANGLCHGTALLGVLAALAGTLAFALRAPSTARRTGLLLAALGAVVVSLIGTRVAQVQRTSVQVCDGAACDDRGAWWQRLLDEQQCAQAGLLLTTRGEEGREMKAAFASAYAAQPAGGPNALLMASHFGGVSSLRFEPQGEGPLPTVIFLHGFGGLLTPYVHSLARELGGRFIVVAPALDNVGVWASRRGQQVLRATLASLPTRADRTKLFLIGLSNGGVGATAALVDPGLRGTFAGFVLLSGVGAISPAARLEGARVLVVTGTADPRFPFSYVEAQTEALKRAGANTEALSLPAAHALVFTHAPQWIRHFEAWTRRLD